MNKMQNQQQYQDEHARLFQLTHSSQKNQNAQTKSNDFTDVEQSIESFKILILMSFVCYGLVFIIMFGEILGITFQDQIKITTDKGQTLTLKYKTPQIIKFNKIQEHELKKIQLDNQQQIVQQLQRMKDGYGLFMQLQKNKNNSLIFQAEYQFYRNRFNLDKPRKQNFLCIISPFKNFVSQNNYKDFLIGLNQQNYSNYQVYMIDDLSTDNSTQQLIKIIQNYPHLKNRLTIIKNKQWMSALANRDITTRNFCPNNSIIIQNDADDHIVGKQVLNIINSIYTDNPQIWFMYTQFRRFNKQGEEILGIKYNEPISYEIFKQNSYRTQLKVWNTRHQRTYLKSLYIKIPMNYLLNQTDKYYIWSSDRYNMYALTQLAGPKHTKFVNYTSYYYIVTDLKARYPCQTQQVHLSTNHCRHFVPLMPLENLQQNVSVSQNYEIPLRVFQQQNKFKIQLQNCLNANKDQK